MTKFISRKVVEDKIAERREYYEELVRRYQAGEPVEAELIREHAGSISRLYSTHRLRYRDRQDLWQEARIAILASARSWNPNSGTSAAGWTYSHIKWAMSGYVIRLAEIVRRPAYQYDPTECRERRAVRWRSYTMFLSDRRVFRIMNAERHASEESVTHALLKAQGDVPTGLEEVMSDAELEQRARTAVVRLVYQVLTLSQLQVITRRFLLERPDTLEDIAASRGVSRERIRQIEQEAIGKLRIVVSRLIKVKVEHWPDKGYHEWVNCLVSALESGAAYD